MSMQDSVYKSAVPRDGGDSTNGKSAEKIYRVVLEGIKSDIETTDSFAIKYGILTSTPVTKIKFMLRNLPKTILETKNGPKARGALERIEEAGGIGMIEDYSPEEKLKVEIAEEEPTIATIEDKNCLKCGFPLKKNDEYCQFCHSPVGEKKIGGIKTMIKAGGGVKLVSPGRLIFYGTLVLLTLLWRALTS